MRTMRQAEHTDSLVQGHYLVEEVLRGRLEFESKPEAGQTVNTLNDLEQHDNLVLDSPHVTYVCVVQQETLHVREAYRRSRRSNEAVARTGDRPQH